MGVLYLYGAAVQGIQDFIFQTNELKDIVGASELVAQICSTAFGEFSEGVDGDPVVMAAGNIKYIFRKREDCEKAVLSFPRKIMEMAPGITISQAVVSFEESSDFAVAVDELEAKLRSQRNKKLQSTTLGLTGMRRSRKTGKPVVAVSGAEHLDAAVVEKRKFNNPLSLCESFFGFRPDASQFSYNIGDMTGGNDWIAVIHADGNGLGAVVQKVGKNANDFRSFSESLDAATRKSAQEAFAEVMEKSGNASGKQIPMRPIVLSGDDMTVICRGDLALDLTRAFLERFEENTKVLAPVLLKYSVFENCNTNLSACAGIAFIKSSYPFYYGYDLAEDLCSRAKKDAKAGDPAQKKLAPSCLMFHKVQDSFVVSYDEISRRELRAGQASFEYGPYYLEQKEDRLTVDSLLELREELQGEEGNAVKTDIRQWLSLMHTSAEAAEQKERRVRSLLSGSSKALFNTAVEPVMRNGMKTYPAYDLLSLNSIFNPITNEE